MMFLDRQLILRCKY